MLMGVVLPVSTPSTVTFAPDGNEVTFSDPFCPIAETAANKPIKIEIAANITLRVSRE
jgi:hypothetical protein